MLQQPVLSEQGDLVASLQMHLKAAMDCRHTVPHCGLRQSLEAPGNFHLCQHAPQVSQGNHCYTGSLCNDATRCHAYQFGQTIKWQKCLAMMHRCMT